MSTPPLSCNRCFHWGEPSLGWKESDSGQPPHLGAYCRKCERWIKWVPQNDLWLRDAPTRPS